MRRIRLMAVALAVCATAAAAPAAEHPLSDATIQVRYGDPAARQLIVRGRWGGSLPATAGFAGATLRVAGAFGEGGTEVIALRENAWRALPKGRGYHYVDRAGTAAGIRSIVVRRGRGGRPGVLRVRGKGLAYLRRAVHTRLSFSLEIGLDRWCAATAAPTDDGERIAGESATAPAACAPDIVVDTTWLQARLGRPDVQLIDTRATFTSGHIPSALPLRPEDLATAIGGVDFQMMPPALAEPVLSALGLRREATVVVYGVAPEYDPARVTWGLYYLGHPDVRYLDGGFDAWVATGGSVAAGAPAAATPTIYVAGTPRDVRVTATDVLTELGAPPYDMPAIRLVDARTPGEFGSGRIPSAMLRQWTANLSGGFLRPRSELEDEHAALGLDPGAPTVTYCLVGWRASVAWLTLHWLGFDDARVYDGSWLEWGAGGFPVETGP